MGLSKRLKGMTQEYLKSPRNQYFKYLEKVLNLHSKSGVKKVEVVNYVKKWADK